MRGAHEKHTVPAVIKALELMRVLAEEQRESTTTALAKRLGIPRTSCYRILRSLASRDWIRAVEGGRYEMSLGLFPLLGPLRRYEAFVEAVRPGLEALAQRTKLTAKVSVRQGDDAVMLARCESPMDTSVSVRVGAAFPLALGSSGAVLLSDLSEDEVGAILKRAPSACWAHQKRADVFHRIEELRAKGYCADFGSWRPTCHAISSALRSPRRAVLAVVTVIGFPHELTCAQVPVLSRTLLKAARQMEQAVAGLPLPDFGGLSS